MYYLVMAGIANIALSIGFLAWSETRSRTKHTRKTIQHLDECSEGQLRLLRRVVESTYA